MFRALRWRLAISNGLLLALILSGSGYLGLAAFRSRTDRAATRELEQIVDELTGRMAIAGIAAINDHHAHPSDAAVLISVFDASGGFLGGTLPRSAWLQPQESPIADASVGGDPVRFVTRGAVFPDGSEVTVVVARSLERLQGQLRDLESILRIGLFFSLVTSGLFGWWVSGRMIRPVARSYEAQRDFASDASHELRTPLTFIRAGVEVLAPGRPELGAQVLDEVDYMAALTDRLLLLARAERGELSIEPNPFDVSEVCRSSIERSSVAHGTRIDLEGHPTMALADRYLTETILDVLLENVSRHGAGVAQMTCRTEGRAVEITVSDQGRGMDPGDFERIFVRFARLEKSRDRESGGAGLGLPLARTLARRQRGDLTLSVAPGGGLRATLRLPKA